MKQKKIRDHDADDDADDTVQNSVKIGGDMNTVSSSILSSTGSYDTTEDLTDTDTSSQDKSARRKIDSNVNRKKNTKNGSSDSNANDSRVRFAMKSNTIHDVESHENFTAKERGNYWWSEREKDRMMAKHERLVAKYEQSRSATKPGTTKKASFEKMGSYRGLESWTAAGSLKLDYTIEQCISAVMDEQDRQWNENDDDSLVIAKKSLAVTEDSARRARLNGLQDAQEALKVRGESWSKGASDEVSVSSGISTGTAAIAKKKKRSKLLARLDDSHNIKLPKSDSRDNIDVLASFKKSSSESKKDKKKKKKSRRKSLDDNMSSSSSRTRKKKSKTKDKIHGVDQNSSTSISKGDESDTISQDQANRRNSAKIQAIIASLRDQGLETSQQLPDLSADDVVSNATPAGSETVSSFCAEQTAPVSPLSMDVPPNHSIGGDDLLATLRRQQEQLRRSSSDDVLKSPINQYRQQNVIDDEDEGEETSDLLQTLRRQQKKQALSWQNEQHDVDDGGSSRLSSCNREGDTETPKFSDPPGRRPRRLASRHVGANRAIPENSVSDDSKLQRSRSRSHDKYEKKMLGRSGISSKASSDSGDLPPTAQSPDMDEDKSNFLRSPSIAGKKSLRGLRSGAKTFFKKVSK